MPTPAQGVPSFDTPAPWGLDGPFRQNIEKLLRTHGSLVHLGLPRVTAWYIRMLDEAGAVSVHLQVYKEEVKQDEDSICDACRNMGACGCGTCNNREANGSFFVSDLFVVPVTLPY